MRTLSTLALGLSATLAAWAQPAPTYTGEIRALLAKHCSGCHTKGGVGRLALDTYDQAKAFAREIEHNANNRQMPPVFAVPGYGEFRNENPLTPAEIQTLLHWTDAGSPLGPVKATNPAVAATTTWAAGPPNLVLVTPAVTISGSPGYETRCVPLPTKVTAARSVRMIDVLPGDRRVVYQVRLYAGDTRGCALTASEGRTLLGQWTPGIPAEPLPLGATRPLPAGATVVAEVTYQKVGLPVTDSSRIGLYFQPAARPTETVVVSNTAFAVPPGEWNHRVDASRTLDRDITLLAIAPSMRKLGMEMRIDAVLPNGTTETLLWVRDFDYRRNKTYELLRPKHLPAGTRIAVSAQFNNSDSNRWLAQGKQTIVRAGALPDDEEMTVLMEFLQGSL